MSDHDEPRLDDRVRDAIEAQLAAEGGGWAVSYHLVVDLIDANGEQGWAYATMPGQLVTTSMGLVEWSRGVLRYEQAVQLDAEADDEDGD